MNYKDVKKALGTTQKVETTYNKYNNTKNTSKNTHTHSDINWLLAELSTEASVFLVPVSSPVNFHCVENLTFSGRTISEQHLSELAFL